MPMEKYFFLSLAFFSKHFNVPIEQLSWGLKEEILKDEQIFTPCIIISGSHHCIDIFEKEFRSPFEFSPQSYRRIHAVKLTEKKNEIELETLKNVFKGETFFYQLTTEALQNTYQYCWYDKTLEKQILY